MYIEIQRKINRYMIFIFIIISFIIAFLVGLFHSYHYSKSILIFLIFLLFILMNLLIRFMERNLEHHYQYKMLQRQQVALARINRAHFYKEIRDSNFKKQFIYELDIDIFTLDQKKISTKIYENIHSDDFHALPGYTYVTYQENSSYISIIPTMLLSMSPQLEPIIKQYEKQNDICYIMVIKKNGLSFKKMKDIVSAKKSSVSH